MVNNLDSPYYNQSKTKEAQEIICLPLEWIPRTGRAVLGVEVRRFRMEPELSSKIQWCLLLLKLEHSRGLFPVLASIVARRVGRAAMAH